jgi:hypothetical protein
VLGAVGNLDGLLGGVDHVNEEPCKPAFLPSSPHR